MAPEYYKYLPEYILNLRYPTGVYAQCYHALHAKVLCPPVYAGFSSLIVQKTPCASPPDAEIGIWFDSYYLLYDPLYSERSALSPDNEVLASCSGQDITLWEGTATIHDSG